MSTENTTIRFALLLESLEADFDSTERNRILSQLKNSTPTDDAMLGAKMFLEQNNWDYLVLKKALAKTENRIEAMALKTQKPKSPNYFKYAAVLLPIAFALGYFINPSLTNKQSMDQFYIREEGLPNYMGTEKTNWDNLMELYRANKMKEAFVVSEQILVQKPQNDTAIYFHGVISYELKKYNLAKTDYAKITQNKQSVFYYDATFRLGFVLNNLQELKTSKKQFEKVAKDAENPFNGKAEVVLEEF